MILVVAGKRRNPESGASGITTWVWAVWRCSLPKQCEGQLLVICLLVESSCFCLVMIRNWTFCFRTVPTQCAMEPLKICMVMRQVLLLCEITVLHQQHQIIRFAHWRVASGHQSLSWISFPSGRPNNLAICSDDVWNWRGSTFWSNRFQKSTFLIIMEASVSGLWLHVSASAEVTHIEFQRNGSSRIGRQTQTWLSPLATLEDFCDFSHCTMYYRYWEFEEHVCFVRFWYSWWYPLLSIACGRCCNRAIFAVEWIKGLTFHSENSIQVNV